MKGEIPLSSFCYCKWFGEIIKMKVVAFDKPSGKYQVKHLDAEGSFYTFLETTKDKIHERDISLYQLGNLRT
jgi:hypothetical protein